jgi:hypothetical protein
MKIAMTLLVRDEEDILSANIDFHLKMGVDFIIATDNRSSDRTKEILLRYEQSGVLHYIYEDQDNYAQHNWVTRMARLAATRFGADWVINNDADEFWWPEQGDLKSTLSSFDPSVQAVVAPRTNFVPRPFERGSFFADVMTVRDAVSVNALGKPLPDKVCHRGFPDIEVAQGNHSARWDGSVLTGSRGGISILHFPMRSYEQFENKIIKGGAALARNTELRKQGGTWCHLYEVWSSGGLKNHYDSFMPTEPELGEGLKAGRFVRDLRLKHFFEQNVGIRRVSNSGA